MSAQLDSMSLVPAVDQPVAEKPATTSIRDAVLAQFKEAETIITGLAEKYRDVAFDVATPKGMKEAIAARADLRDNGRLFVTNSEARIKGEVNDLKRVMAAETDRLVAIVQPIERHVDDQIKAEETRKAAEKAERERIAAEKAEAHRAKIAKIRAAADNAKGITSERIKNGIALVESLTFGEECESFLPEYKQAQAETLASMRQSLADAQAREAAEAQRLENERIAAELAAQRAALEAEAAELKRQQAEALAARVAITHAAVFAFPGPEPKAEQAPKVEYITPPTPSAAEQVADLVEPEARRTVVAPGPIGDALARGFAAEFAAADGEPEIISPYSVSPPTIKTGCDDSFGVVSVDSAGAEPTLITTAQLGDLLGLPVQSALIESLGFTAIKLKKPGAYWDQAKVKEIGKALIAHIAKNIEGL